MSQMQLNFLAAFVNTALKQYSNISLSGKSFRYGYALHTCWCKDWCCCVKVISILPVLKTSITGAPVDNTRKFFSCSFEEFSKYHNKNCFVFSSSALSLSWKLKVFRTLVAVSFSFPKNSSSKWSMCCFISSRKPRTSRPLANWSRAIFRQPITSCMMRFCIISILFLFLKHK